MNTANATMAATSHARLLAVAAAVFDVAPHTLTDESSPDSIPAWDSLNHLNLVMAVESEFALALSADEVMQMGSLALVRSVLREHGVEI
jgi:acyl carrier protein